MQKGTLREKRSFFSTGNDDDGGGDDDDVHVFLFDADYDYFNVDGAGDDDDDAVICSPQKLTVFGLLIFFPEL